MPLLILIISVCAIYVAIQSKRQARAANQMNLFYQIMARYSSPEIGEALEIIWWLSETREEEEGVFLEVVKKYRNKENIYNVNWSVEGVFKKSYYVGLDYKEINQAQRLVSQFFTLTFDLFTDFEVLEAVYFKKICSIDTFKFLYHVNEWLELALNPDYARKTWTDLLEQSGRKDIKDLKRLRPPETWAEIEQNKNERFPGFS